MTDPDPYHALSGNERDHLLAAAWYSKDEDTLPAGADVTRTVRELTDHDPNHNTTVRALATLADVGFIERVDGEPTAQARGVRVTDAGERALKRAAARLDAAATVEVDG